MLRKTFSGLILVVLLTGILTSTLDIQPVKASGTIYIRSDGSIDPSYAPISTVDNITYTFTGNISSDVDGIVVERSNIIIDGSGYTIEGTGATGSEGISLSGIANITVKNTNIKNFILGVYVYSSSSNMVSGNNLTNNGHGVALGFSFNNTVSGNNITNNNYYGVYLGSYSNNNTVSGNNITNNLKGVFFLLSFNNTVSGNNITNSSQHGVQIRDSFNNTVSGNNITNSTYLNGVYLDYSSNNNTVCGNNITNNNRHGICLEYSFNNTVSGNNITNNNWDGVYLDHSSNNTVSGNNITNNNWDGVYLDDISNNNAFYHNNFIDNIRQVYSVGLMNVWDDGYPSGGNYWSDYTDVDLYSGPYQNETDGDGIWDHPYVIDADNQDRYPLTNPWQVPINSPWPMFQHDAQHTGRSPFVGPINGSQTQIFLGNETIDDIFGSLVIGSDGTLYFGAKMNSKSGLYAFFPNSAQKWFYETASAGLKSPALLESAHTVYTFSNREVLAVNTENGGTNWNKSFAYIYDNLVVGDDELLYFTALRQLPDSSFRNYLISLNRNGEDALAFDIAAAGSERASCPAIDKQGIIYFGFNDTLFAIYPNGTERWRKTFNVTRALQLNVQTPSIGCDGTIYVPVEGARDDPRGGGNTGSLYGIYPNGTVKWEVGVGYGIGIPLIGPDGSVYVDYITYPVDAPIHHVLALDPEGFANWHLSSYDSIIPRAVDAEGTIYITEEQVFRAVNPDGSEKWRWVASDDLGWLSIGVNGTLYIPSRSKLYVIRDLLPPDFSIMAFPTSLTIQQGSSDTSTVTITSINGFNQPVQLFVSGIPSGVMATLNPEQVTPPPDGSTTSTLTVSVDTTATTGSYTLTVNGTSGDLTHSKYISLEITSVLPPPNPPTLVSPGSSSSPGEEIYTLTPALTWNSVPGAGQYGLYIRDMDSEELVFDSQVRGITITGTSYTLPSGILQWGKHYRWNMNSHNEASWGEFSPPLYFYTAQLGLLSEIIQQEMQEKVTVTVDGKEYYIVTIGRYISPSTWEPSDYTFLAHAPDVRKVYTNTDFIPILDRQLAKKIGIIDRANNLLKHVGSPGSILIQLGVIDDIFEADKDLADAEYAAVWEKTAIFMIVDLCFFVEIEQPISISHEIFYIIKEQLQHYFDPEQFILEGGRALLEAAKLHYREAKRIAEESTEGIYDYDTAENYLNSFYSARFKMEYGVDIVLPRERISKSAFWEIVGWIPDYINHLGAKITSHISLWGKIGVISVKVGEIAKLPIENMDRLSEFIENAEEIENMVAQLLEDESFPVDYTQALAYQDITMLARWGIKIDRVPWKEIGVYLACPAELRVYDSSGNVTGTVEGEIRMEIPNSFYYNNTVTVFLPNDTYTIEVMGTGTGTYRLEALYVEDKSITSFVAIDLPTSSNVTHQYTVDWDALSQGDDGVTVEIDVDGDGVFEHQFLSDSNLTGDELEQAISHDISLDAIVPSKNVVGEGYSLLINVTFKNQGTHTETFNLTIYANTTIIHTLRNITLPIGNSTTVTFTWNTTDYAKGNYTISAYATPVDGETDLADNNFTDGWVVVTIPGDVDGDFDVDIYDVVKITGIYGSKHGDPQFNPNSDLDDDGEIKIYDVVICTSHYGQSW